MKSSQPSRKRPCGVWDQSRMLPSSSTPSAMQPPLALALTLNPLAMQPSLQQPPAPAPSAMQPSIPLALAPAPSAMQASLQPVPTLTPSTMQAPPLLPPPLLPPAATPSAMQSPLPLLPWPDVFSTPLSPTTLEMNSLIPLDDKTPLYPDAFSPLPSPTILLEMLYPLFDEENLLHFTQEEIGELCEEIGYFHACILALNVVVWFTLLQRIKDMKRQYWLYSMNTKPYVVSLVLLH